MRKIFYLAILLLQILNAFGSRISEQKCDKYRKMIPSSQEILDDARKYSFMVKVFIGNDDYRNGELISENFVISAGKWSSNEAATVEVGFLSAGTYNDQTQVIAVSEQIRKPNTNLCLLKLVESVEFSDYIRPVCLNHDVVDEKEYYEISIKNGLRRRENTITMIEEWPVRRLFGNDCENGAEMQRKHNEWQLFTEGDALFNEHDEMLGIKMENSDKTCLSTFYEISDSHNLHWIEENVWPDAHTTTTVTPIPTRPDNHRTTPIPTRPSNTGMETCSLSLTVLLITALTCCLFQSIVAM